MLKAEIVLWLLASIYGLEIASVVKRDVGVESFNTDHTQGNIQIKVNNLMLESITDWRDIQLFLSIMHKNASLVFETKLMQELHNVRLAVETAHENGTDASYCIEDTENTFVVFQQDVEVKLSECKVVGWKDFTDGYQILSKIRQTGIRAVKEIQNIFQECDRKSLYLNKCYGERAKIARYYVQSFYEKLEFQSAYRKLVFVQMFDKYAICLKTHIDEGIKKVNAFRPISKSCVDGAE
uniref:Venom protein n=1 Tax=Ampulex compressa TaxID=860918 RepID=A0A1W6EVX2_AMPCP|nr:venom protein [Ampulex compressa]